MENITISNNLIVGVSIVNEITTLPVNIYIDTFSSSDYEGIYKPHLMLK